MHICLERNSSPGTTLLLISTLSLWYTSTLQQQQQQQQQQQRQNKKRIINPSIPSVYKSGHFINAFSDALYSLLIKPSYESW